MGLNPGKDWIGHPVQARGRFLQATPKLQLLPIGFAGVNFLAQSVPVVCQVEHPGAGPVTTTPLSLRHLHGTSQPICNSVHSLQGWNLRNLDSLLSRTLEAKQKSLPGVTTPYLYFGMWRSTFAW